MDLRRRNRVKAEGGMSSMTDLVFLMLIFFIIMSTMSSPALPVDLPTGEGVTGEDASIHVGVNPDNSYFFEGEADKTYTFEDFTPLLESKMANSEEKNIKISGDRSADYEYVFNLIALSKTKGWRPILVFK